MKRTFITWLIAPIGFIIFCLGFSKSQANNIAVSNISVTGQNTAAGQNHPANFTFVKFDLSWENSWRTSSAPNNWDAAWVFVKYRIAGGEWLHAHLHGSGHQAPTGCTIDAGLQSPGSAFNITTNPGLGAFVYRSTDGSGTFSPANIQLRWNYGSNSVTDNAVMEVRVFAIEMVYVTQGNFYAGDATSLGSIYSAPNTNTPYEITAENTLIPVGSTSGNLTYAGGTSYGDQAGPIPAAFPKGFAAFYCMKYEITQLQYVDFLNTLTVSQQATRTAVATSSPSGTGALSTSNANRNGIDIQTPSFGSTPAVYACNLNGNTVFNETDDGQWIACNWLSWADLAAYLDWSALRPMTELEFEKACRGPVFPLAGEFAWGSTILTNSGGSLINPGTNAEASSTANANCNAGLSFNGPVRVGIFAGVTTTRVQSGGSYYGIMEMSGNLWERTVTIGNAFGRSFTGQHGNGLLNAGGSSDAPNWPDASASGAGYRGGSWDFSSTHLSTSDRDVATNTVSTRGYNRGGRGVRRAP